MKLNNNNNNKFTRDQTIKINSQSKYQMRLIESNEKRSIETKQQQ